MDEIIVAIAQLDVALGDKRANTEKAIKYITDAAKKGANFVCFPEYFSTGFGYKDLEKIHKEIAKLAEPINGQTIRMIQQACRANSVYAIGSIIESAQNKFYNTAFLINPSGELLGTYRKVHLFQLESQFFQQGNGWQVFDTDFGKIGIMICYDAIFPEAARTLALLGAKLILHPSSWMDPYLPQWRIATNARALENQVWLVSVNRVGRDELFTYFGRSRVIDPYGACIYECGGEEELATVRIDLKRAEEFKKTLNFLGDRRPATYRL
ncbi:MAG: carbon-nitrogen hydrolase family protein [Candidatus Bathyarchaeia archaeon]|nr:carbon-nitrogen hydrolase family protein [Candidatus Bathyarchaeota archaeon]